MSEASLSGEQVSTIIDLALVEDTGQGDVTSEILIPPNLQGEAYMQIKDEGMLAGGEVAREVFLKVDPSLEIKLLIQDGTKVKPGDIIATVSGKVTSILKGERTALNFLQRLSGIATQTARYIEKTQGCTARIVDTRKTTPGLRILEKYAVRMGGGHNHRLHMGDAVLIKDTHLEALRTLGMSLKDIVIKAKQNAPEDLIVEVEVNTGEEALEAAGAGADIIMLDNMSPEEMKAVVSSLRGQVKTEASGGITLDNVREAAMTGVHIISIGALTHSTKAMDIGLELDPQTLNLI
ncbi:carboxylating nicotinate-nucleotide diphosphorylase [Chloroflexota bacterium]